MTSNTAFLHVRLNLVLAMFTTVAAGQHDVVLPSDEASPLPVAAAPAEPGPPRLRFNFRGAPLEMVLNYLSEAAGYVIVLDAPLRGTIDMWSAQPVSNEEAVHLLNLALNKQGYTARAQGRTLIISSKEDAKKHNLPIRSGNDPLAVPETAAMVMQIIPLRHIDASRAAADLGPLWPSSATITANEDSNSLVVTDSEINVRHIVTLVSALDSASDSVSTLRVFKLANADPFEMAALLTDLFVAPTGRISRSAAPPAVGNSRGGARASRPRTERTGNATQSPGLSPPLVAIADPRTFSVIVSASKDGMQEIAEMIAQLDASSARRQQVFVYTLENADVRQVENVLKNLFQGGSARTTGSSQPDPLATRASSNTQASGNALSLGTAGRR